MKTEFTSPVMWFSDSLSWTWKCRRATYRLSFLSASNKNLNFEVPTLQPERVCSDIAESTESEENLLYYDPF